jgi:peptidoglycan-associated lipoprotein
MMSMMIHSQIKNLSVVALLVTLTMSACAKKQVPIARPLPPPPTPSGPVSVPDTPPEVVFDESSSVPPEPLGEDTVGARSLDDLNRESPLRPMFFPLDSWEIEGEMQRVLQENAQVMKKYPTWQVTIEGHCDERGTAEYTLGLGERRALSTRDYLVSLGIDASRLRTVSYGKEFPFDPGHNENAWARNRRAHFVITAK